MSDIVTAAMIVIGDEILSGRTKDRNIGHLADMMTAVGIDLKEVRIVPDEEDEIAAAVNALRHRYDYVFTTGGIGPTHDDITADSVAKAFGVPCDYDAKAMRTGARLLSATVPCPHGEGIIGGPLAEIQKAHPDTIIGSYPKYLDGTFRTDLVVRARTQEALDAARKAVEEMVAALPPAA